MAAKTAKLTISIPVELADRLRPFRDSANLSAVCTTALEQLAAKLEAEAAQRAHMEGQAAYLKAIKNTPLIQSIAATLPADVEAQLAARPGYQRDAFKAGWSDAAGTVNPWQTGK